MPGGAGPDPVAERFDEFEAVGWERAAPAYDEVIGKITSQVVDRLLDAVDVSSADRLLDLATGPGHVAARAAERGADPTGLDVTQAMLALAARNHPEITFRRGDMQQLPFGDSSFDVVVGNFAILHAGRPDRVVAEAARVLRPGGRLGLTLWDVPAHSRGFAVVLDALAEVGASSPPEIPPGPPFFQYADEPAFTALLRNGGLDHVDITTLSVSQQVASSEEWWNALLDGAVRTAALIRGQPEDVRAAARNAYDRDFEAFRSPGGYEIPMGVKLGVARRPA